jgi:hypothetical protein
MQLVPLQIGQPQRRGRGRGVRPRGVLRPIKARDGAARPQPRLPPSVGLYKLYAVDPELQSAWFQRTLEPVM